MPIRTTGGVFTKQVLTGSLAHFVVCGADFSGAIDSYGQPVPNSAAEIIFTEISRSAYINIMNPSECNLSFALEAGRSVWDELSLTSMIRSLGTDVGADHIDCSECTVRQVPYMWGCGDSASSFLELTDTPSSYENSAGFVVAVNSTEDGLVFIPATASNAYAFVATPGQSLLSAVGSSTLNILPGTNVSITTDATSNSVTINASGGGSSDYIPVPSGSELLISTKYFVTSPGTVTLPLISGTVTAGQSVIITKKPGSTVIVSVNQLPNYIATDLGNTDAIEFDSTQELVFIASPPNQWNLQIGSRN